MLQQTYVIHAVSSGDTAIRHRPINNVKTAIDATIDIDNSFSQFKRYSHTPIDIIIAIDAAIDIDNSFSNFKRYNHTPIHFTIAIDAAIDMGNSFSDYIKYNHTAIEMLLQQSQ